ncbi:type IV pilus biogenesis/stability protein PilW [Pseudomonas sp. MM211]|uniref:type IV pilus biogenesis/stability protein PilW n=1 Tax=Pseudomonas sp. MM211 TaxID=2866808 RepID=UPI001CEDBF0C|nr:type IV pilus biogenesis/stability protein PilW [Pseudomonas sp. MM211]UCJ16479.1 type IV pilus biogenesis/stability protein PilW [Pseudomonas sp. MM211]
MTVLRSLLFLLSASLLTACVSTGDVDPMKTSEGRKKAYDSFVQLGIGYLQQGQTGPAKVPLKNALNIDSSAPDAHAVLALVFQREMEPKLADEHFRKSLSKNSKDARLLNNYAGFLFEQKRYKEAFERYSLAAEDSLYPERARVFENMGMTAMMLKQRDEAKGYFERSLRLDSRQPRALLEMATLSFEDKQYVPARSYYDGYSAIAEQNARSLLLGARLATIFEDRDRAASIGLQLKRLYPGTPEYQQYLSEQR